MSTANTTPCPTTHGATLDHPVVSREQWLARRIQLLAEEKELTRQHDLLAQRRRELPWVKLDQSYVFDAPGGPRTLSDLFAGRSQLVVYHFMFGPEWHEGCPSCSFVSDHINAAVPHLFARDVALAMVSRAPLPKLEAFRQRMGWTFHWVSSHNNTFNTDFNVSFTKAQLAAGPVEYNYTRQSFPSEEAPGLSVFRKNTAGEIFHTYSTFGRGLEPMLGTYVILDMVPKGRDEDALPFPMAWIRHHDRYGTNTFADADKPYWPKTEDAAKPSCCCASKDAAP